jgi:isoleucyl-tRNA synthetase
MADQTAGRDYRDTLFLPETSFPMKAGLQKLEPETIAHWDKIDLYGQLRADAAARPKFVFHDGPPYANGNLHIGHALNNILKDLCVRTRQMTGFDADFRPGWDCHGLPIEWKVEEEFRAKGRKKQEVPSSEFRAACRAYAETWIEIQKGERKRFGITADWNDPYVTMAYDSEAAIAAEFLKVVRAGLVYRGSKPVMWSPVERTSLAEAEVEYHEKTSSTIWVKFPVVSQPDVSIVIWTTTPWTIPGNRAISFSPSISYGLFEVQSLEQGLAFKPWVKPGDTIVVADKLVDDVMKAAKAATFSRLRDFDPAGLVCAHPFRGKGYDFDVPLLAGDHVTDDAGTGFVHTAPGHGAEDYQIWIARGLSQADIPFTVDEDGRYTKEAPGFEGLEILQLEGKNSGKDGPANKAVIEALIAANALLARGLFKHQYPHSWRSKAPVIFRNTPQWFIAMDRKGPRGKTLREEALAAIDATDWGHEAAKNRIRSMVETRPDWLISRQRAWGVPLAMFVHKETGEILKDDAVDARILAAMKEKGTDAWYSTPAQTFLGPDHPASDYEKVEDILDVWFDSGSTHAFVLGQRPSLPRPADLYLEGSDQHRGWFQSSLLESCATRGHAPYKAVRTHGFTLDEEGRKMSKSLGNVLPADKLFKEQGAELVRLVTASVDYEDDQRIGKTIFEQCGETYRKLRNTMRYLLGALAGFAEAERLPDESDWPLMERWLRHRLWELDGEVRAAYAAFKFRDALTAIVEFCNVEFSAFYVDVRKDSLYCDRPDSVRRRACRTALDAVFERLTAWLAPIMVFTTDEAWRTRYPDAPSVHLRQLPATPETWRDESAMTEMTRLRAVRAVITGALEIERREKRIGSSLDAAPVVWCREASVAEALRAVDFADLCITSAISIEVGEGPHDAFRDEALGIAVEVKPAPGRKCARSRRILSEVGSDPRYPNLSLRDADAVAWWESQRA